MGRTPVRQPGQSICVIRSETGKFFLQDVNIQDGLGPGGMTGPVVKTAPPAGLIAEHTHVWLTLQTFALLFALLLLSSVNDRFFGPLNTPWASG